MTWCLSIGVNVVTFLQAGTITSCVHHAALVARRTYAVFVGTGVKTSGNGIIIAESTRLSDTRATRAAQHPHHHPLIGWITNRSQHSPPTTTLSAIYLHSLLMPWSKYLNPTLHTLDFFLRRNDTVILNLSSDETLSYWFFYLLFSKLSWAVA